MNWAEHNLVIDGDVLRVAAWQDYTWLDAGYTMKAAGNMDYRFGGRDEVEANRRKVTDNWVTMDQVHGNNVLVIESLDQDVTTTDGMITDKKDRTLAVLVADCVPLLFIDPIARRVAVAHAGRRGTFAGIAKITFERLLKSGSRAGDVEVVIGPSIGPCCYVFDDQPLDLWALNEQQLRDAGAQTVIRTDVCTKHTDYFFSHQTDPEGGRFAGFVRIN